MTRALFELGKILVNPFSVYALQSQLAQVLIKLMPSTRANPKKERKDGQARKEDFVVKYFNKDNNKILEQNLIKGSHVDKKFETPSNYITSLIQRFTKPKRYKLLKKSKARIDQELDLV